MPLNLYQIADQYRRAFFQLADSDFDDQTIDDTLEGLEGEFLEVGSNIAAFWLNLGAEVDAIKAAEKRLYDRRKALEARQERLKEYLRVNMARCGITEIKANDSSFVARLYIGRDEVVAISDSSRIPADYLRETVIVEPDKTQIKKAIEDGYDVPGAHIEVRDRLTIK